MLNVMYQSDVIQRQIVGLEYLSQVDEGEEEKQHKGGYEQPAIDQPVALELVSLKEKKENYFFQIVKI